MVAKEGIVAAETTDSIVQMQNQMTVKLRRRSEKIREYIFEYLSTCFSFLTMSGKVINYFIKNNDFLLVIPCDIDYDSSISQTTRNIKSL